MGVSTHTPLPADNHSPLPLTSVVRAFQVESPRTKARRPCPLLTTTTQWASRASPPLPCLCHHPSPAPPCFSVPNLLQQRHYVRAFHGRGTNLCLPENVSRVMARRAE
eukprot:3317163-Amphidinium_carterae.1